MALVAKRTAAAGGADATVNTAAGVWGVIDALLIAAGWTAIFDFSVGVGTWVASTAYNVGDIIEANSIRFQCTTSGVSASAGVGPASFSNAVTDGTVIWRAMTSAGASDKVYQSTGETGNENHYIRIGYDAHVATHYINVTSYQFFDATSKLGWNAIGPDARSYSQFSYVNGNTVNYAMTADKDSFSVLTVDSANAKWVYGAGLLKRWVNTIATSFVANGAVTAGATKTFSFAAGNPIAAGYKIGDRVIVVAQETNVVSPFTGVIPLYAATITALTTSSITIDYAQEATAAGALIGNDPQPRFFVDNSTSNGNSIAIGGAVFTGYIWNASVTNLFSSGTVDKGYTSQGGLPIKPLLSAASAELNPNKRTNRVGIGEYVFTNNNNEISGIIPKIYSNPRLTDAVWSIARSVRETTNYDYVTFPANVASPTSQVRELVGPFATSGAASYTIDLFQFNSDMVIEGEFYPYSYSNYSDRPLALLMIPEQGYNYQTTLIGDEPEFSTDIMPQGVLQEASTHDIPMSGTLIVRITGETHPFDTSVAAGSTGNDSGFNSGFN